MILPVLKYPPPLPAWRMGALFRFRAQPSDASFSLVGGHGLYFDTPYTDIVNDIKVLKVAGGSNEIMRNFIARRVLKDPGHEGLA